MDKVLEEDSLGRIILTHDGNILDPAPKSYFELLEPQVTVPAAF